MKKFINVFLILSLCFVVYSNNVFGKETNTIFPAKDKKSVSLYEEEYKPIEVSTSIKSAELKNGLWDVTFSSNVTLNEENTNDVKFYFELQKMNNSFDSLLVDKKDDIFKKKLKYKNDEIRDFKINKLDIGQYKLILQADSNKDYSSNIGGNTILLFSVKEDGVIEGWEQDVTNYTPAENENGKLKNVFVTPDSPNYGELNKETTLMESNQRFSLASSATFSGYWKMYDRNGSVTGVKYGKAELRYRDQYSIWRIAGTDYTDSTGYYNISFTYPSQSNLWELRIYSIAEDAGKVENNSGGNYYTYSQWLTVTNGSNNPGNLYVPNGSSGNEIGRAFWVYDDLARTEGRLDDWKAPGTSTIVWYSGATTSAQYSLGGKVYLNDRSPDSPTTAIHEIGHNYMYNLYNGNFPPGDCSSGHTYNGESDPGCAWTEGWSHFLALYMNNSPIYTYTSGTTWNAENTSTFPTGDDCEGRVAGALWDVYDNVSDGYDTYSFSFTYIYAAMYRDVNNNLADWWNDWKALGYSTNAKESIKQNSISYY
jgi:hypothetical protein